MPQPRWSVVTADRGAAEVERLAARCGGAHVWVKAPNGSHGRGVIRCSGRSGIAGAVHRAMRNTPDGSLCLIEQDVCAIVADADGRRQRRG